MISAYLSVGRRRWRAVARGKNGWAGWSDESNIQLTRDRSLMEKAGGAGRQATMRWRSLCTG